MEDTPLKIKNAAFITSAATAAQFLKTGKPLIAVCGKSNVGKSTFINMLAGQKRLARTSAAPGRTRLVNYFDFGQFILADLPGYGYAEVSKAEKAKWSKTLDAFFGQKSRLAHVFLLLDCRHDPTAEDLQMLNYLNYHIVPFTAVLTKTDKLSKMKLKEQTVKIAAKAGLAAGNVIATSGETRAGKDEILQKIARIIALQTERAKSDGETNKITEPNGTEQAANE
ncbi:MAG: ribosome biogenesis GTP-binding protein YihA/YsxC [Candidatus Borkfalkiaceae bacterium]|nr:ribosome biogenesis GTP-binding protein YihA/YsxC [Clostridia bacterium]MDY6224088.1 ribosome biogenesis GTP-binding protein YihA/YsxC [Christensenellaceae bacterium]